MDLVMIAMGLTALIGLIMGLKNSNVLNGRTKAVEVINETAGASADIASVLKRTVDALADDKITAEELADIMREADEVKKHAVAIKERVTA